MKLLCFGLPVTRRLVGSVVKEVVFPFTPYIEVCVMPVSPLTGIAASSQPGQASNDEHDSDTRGPTDDGTNLGPNCARPDPRGKVCHKALHKRTPCAMRAGLAPL